MSKNDGLVVERRVDGERDLSKHGTTMGTLPRVEQATGEM